MLTRQVFKRLAHVKSEVDFGSYVVRRLICWFLLPPSTLALLFAPVVMHKISGDSIQIRFLPRVIAVFDGTLKKFDVGILKDILGESIILHDTNNITPERMLCELIE